MWVTGTSQIVQDYAEIFANKLISVALPKLDDLIIEIASNDGTFLKPFINKGFNII